MFEHGVLFTVRGQRRTTERASRGTGLPSSRTWATPDLKASLEVQHIAAHSDAGLVFRAENKRDFYGGHESSLKEAGIHTWDSHHCQAYPCLSRHNGYTWSQLKNIDGDSV